MQIPPHIRHWHGAGGSEPGGHFAIAEALDGSSVIWLELVSAGEYAAALAGCPPV